MEGDEMRKSYQRSPKRASKALEVQDIIQGAVSNFVGITRAVRQHLLPDKQLLDVSGRAELVGGVNWICLRYL